MEDVIFAEDYPDGLSYSVTRADPGLFMATVMRGWTILHTGRFEHDPIRARTWCREKIKAAR